MKTRFERRNGCQRRGDDSVTPSCTNRVGVHVQANEISRSGTRDVGLNRLLDSLPRPTVGRYAREVPTFRNCGVIGFHVAVVATLTAGLITGRSLLVLTVLSTICALSFFGYSYLRMWISGEENLVLLEHVWVALLSCAALLWIAGLPVLSYLDAVAIGLSFFLAAGRIGCFLVGCCHGMPSSIGVSYRQEQAQQGFPRYFVGVRLFPVQLVEAGILAAIGTGGLFLVRNSPPGTVLSLYLIVYSIGRFGLEGLRGDQRPHFAGISQSRWMCIAEFGTAIWLTEASRRYSPSVIASAVVVLGLAAILASWHLYQRQGRFLRRRHLRELARLAEQDANVANGMPVVKQSSCGVRTALSRDRDGSGWHLSMSMPDGVRDLQLLARLAAQTRPDLDPDTGFLSRDWVLHASGPSSVAERPGVLAEHLLARAAASSQERDFEAGTSEHRPAYFGEPASSR
jgi:prolipoprotein diacylglyceryltransferase